MELEVGQHFPMTGFFFFQKKKHSTSLRKLPHPAAHSTTNKCWSKLQGKPTCRVCWPKTLCLFLECFETVASWQLCIDHNTTSARLSKLGATPAAQVSGGQTPPSANQETRHCQSSAASPPHLSTFRQSQTTRQRASPGKRDPTKDDSPALSLPAPRLQGNTFHERARDRLAPQLPGNSSRHGAHLPRQK